MNDSDKKRELLFKEFPPVSTEEWEQVIKRDLNGADYKEKLRWKTLEGIEVLPFYRQKDLEELARDPAKGVVPKATNDWTIVQPVYASTVPEAREEAAGAVKKGVDGLLFKTRLMRSEGMLVGDLEGTAVQGQSDFHVLLDGIPVEKTPLIFDCGPAAPAFLAMLSNERDERGISSETIHSFLTYDPVAFFATRGHLHKPADEIWSDTAGMIRFCRNRLPHTRFLCADARICHNAGATIVQELGFALSTANEYIANLTDRNFGVDEIARHIHFFFSTGSNYFLEIAKYRALRLLWEKILTAYDAQRPADCHISAESSLWNKTVFDPHTNLLRTTTESMSAAIAGCDALIVHPFDTAFERPGEFARRIARNSQIILKTEAYLDQVVDPAAGSYYIEVLTDKIAGEAWNCFQEVEKQGGIVKAIEGKYVQWAVDESRKQRDRAIAMRGRVFVGVNQYPDPEERMSEKVTGFFSATSLQTTDFDGDIEAGRLVTSLADALKRGALMGDVVSFLLAEQKQLYPALQPYRGAEVFEELRLATERHAHTPAVLLAPLGNPGMRKVRSTFAANFFGCAGYEIKDYVGFDTLGEAVDQIKKQAPDVVVLCSSDEGYKEYVKPLCKQLETLDPRPVMVVAGNPKEEADTYRSLGVDEFIHTKSNVLEMLKKFHGKLGISDSLSP